AIRNRSTIKRWKHATLGVRSRRLQSAEIVLRILGHPPAVSESRSERIRAKPAPAAIQAGGERSASESLGSALERAADGRFRVIRARATRITAMTTIATPGLEPPPVWGRVAGTSFGQRPWALKGISAAVRSPRAVAAPPRTRNHSSLFGCRSELPARRFS